MCGSLCYFGSIDNLSWVNTELFAQKVTSDKNVITIFTIKKIKNKINNLILKYEFHQLEIK